MVLVYQDFIPYALLFFQTVIAKLFAARIKHLQNDRSFAYLMS